MSALICGVRYEIRRRPDARLLCAIDHHRQQYGVGGKPVLCAASDGRAIYCGAGAQSSIARSLQRILFVCMGNICRSPTAEAVFRALASRMDPKLAIEADSAGTHDYHVGDPPDPRSQRVAASHGIDMSTLRARKLTAHDIERFDWILVMDRQNLDAVRAMAAPELRDRVQLLLDHAPEQGLREVPDPYYGGTADFELVFQLTQQAALGLLKFLRTQSLKGRS